MIARFNLRSREWFWERLLKFIISPCIFERLVGYNDSVEYIVVCLRNFQQKFLVQEQNDAAFNLGRVSR